MTKEAKDERARVRVAEAIRASDATEVARRLGISTEAALRFAVGARQQAGTEMLIASRLDRLDDGPRAA